MSNTADLSQLNTLDMPEEAKEFLRAYINKGQWASTRFKIKLSPQGNYFHCSSVPPLAEYSAGIDSLPYLISYLANYKRIDLRSQIRVYDHYFSEISDISHFLTEIPQLKPTIKSVADSQSEAYEFLNDTDDQYESKRDELAQGSFSSRLQTLLEAKHLTSASFEPDFPASRIRSYMEMLPALRSLRALTSLWRQRENPAERLSGPEADMLLLAAYPDLTDAKTRLEKFQKPVAEQSYGEFVEALFYKKNVDVASFKPILGTPVVKELMRMPTPYTNSMIRVWKHLPDAGKRLSPEEEAQLRSKILHHYGLSEKPASEQSYEEYFSHLLYQKALSVYDFEPAMGHSVSQLLLKRPGRAFDRFMDLWKELPEPDKRITAQEEATLREKAVQLSDRSEAPLEALDYSYYMQQLFERKGLNALSFEPQINNVTIYRALQLPSAKATTAQLIALWKQRPTESERLFYLKCPRLMLACLKLSWTIEDKRAAVQLGLAGLCRTL